MRKKMKEKIAGQIVHIAEKAAYKSVGKSCVMGAHEISIPTELMNRKKGIKK